MTLTQGECLGFHLFSFQGSKNVCPLCGYQHISFYSKDKKREYYQCQQCHLVFVALQFLPSLNREKHEYGLHQNAFDDLGYVRFLTRPLQAAIDCLCHQNISTSTVALDYGCGPAPVLAAMLAKQLAIVDYYDPLFFPNLSLNKLQYYDLIVCTEVAEHFHHPKHDFDRLFSLLKPNGYLVVMTKRVISQQRFANWHYKNDVTHVSFYSETTFEWLANHHKTQVIFAGSDIAIFHNNIEPV